MKNREFAVASVSELAESVTENQERVADATPEDIQEQFACNDIWFA